MKTAPNCQGHMGLLAFMPHTSFRTHRSHHLPTAMARYDYTTGLPWKSWTRYSLVWQPDLCFFFFWRFLVTAQACSESWNWCCSMLVPLQGRLLIFSFVFKGFFIVVGKASDKLALWWHALCCMGEAEICCLLWSLIIVVASGQELTHHPNLMIDSLQRKEHVKLHQRQKSCIQNVHKWNCSNKMCLKIS